MTVTEKVIYVFLAAVVAWETFFVLRLERPLGARVLAAWHVNSPPSPWPSVTLQGLAVGRDGRIYAVDAGRRAVVIVTEGSAAAARLGPNAVEPAFALPFDVAIGARSELFVSDFGASVVRSLAPDGRFSRTLEPPGGFGGVAGIAADEAGNLYAADVERRAVFAFDPNGRPLWRSDGNGAWRRPVDVAISRDGDLYVLDVGAKRVHILTKVGLPKASFPVRVSGSLALLALDTAGHVYITDPFYDCVAVYGPRGRPLGRIDNSSVGQAIFSKPTGIAAEADGTMVIANTTSGVVVRLRPKG